MASNSIIVDSIGIEIAPVNLAGRIEPNIMIW